MDENDHSSRSRGQLIREIGHLREQVKGLESVCSPETEEGALRSAVRHAERKHRNLFLNAPIGIFQCDARRRPLSINPRMASMLGYDSPEEMTFKVRDMADVLAIGHNEVMRLLRELRENWEVHGYEAPGRRRDGSLVWLSLSVSVTRDAWGAIQWFDGYVIDITKKRELDKLREDMEHIMRHDLKNPLLGVLSGVKMLERRLANGSEPEECVEIIRDQAEKALAMVNESLELFKMEQGVFRPRWTSEDAADLFQRVRGSVDGELEKKGVAIDFVMDGEAVLEAGRIELGGDPPHLENLFANLLRNAVEASPENERVTVAISRAEDLAVDIHNKGVIPEEVRPRFFERGATHGKTHGSGLGAYSARLIARAHGGDITFSTSEEEGTHVIVRLPLEPPAEAAGPDETGPGET